MPNVVRDADAELLALKRVERAVGGLKPNQALRVLRFAWERNGERMALGVGGTITTRTDVVAVTPEEGA